MEGTSLRYIDFIPDSTPSSYVINNTHHRKLEDIWGIALILLLFFKILPHSKKDLRLLNLGWACPVTSGTKLKVNITIVSLQKFFFTNQKHLQWLGSIRALAKYNILPRAAFRVIEGYQFGILEHIFLIRNFISSCIIQTTHNGLYWSISPIVKEAWETKSIWANSWPVLIVADVLSEMVMKNFRKKWISHPHLKNGSYDIIWVLTDFWRPGPLKITL